MDNYTITYKKALQKVVEMVDDIEGLLINDATWLPHPNQLIKMNKLWKRYECK